MGHTMVEVWDLRKRFQKRKAKENGKGNGNGSRCTRNEYYEGTTRTVYYIVRKLV